MFFEYYKKIFQESDNSIYWGGETITRTWDDGTLYLYSGIFIFSLLVGVSIDKKQTRIIKGLHAGRSLSYKSINQQLKFFFIILLCFLGLRHKSVGIDTIVYRNTIENATSLSQLFNESTSEPLYLVFQYALHVLFKNGAIGILIYSFFTLYFIYKGIKKNERYISLYLSLLVYVSLYYFTSFNLLRISLASSIIFSFFYLLTEEKYIKYFCLICCVSFLHYSTIVMILPFGLYLIYIKSRKAALIFITLCVFVLLYATISLGEYLSLINRYSGYIDKNDGGGGIGIMFFIDYLPCIIICFYILRRKIRNKWADLMICFTVSACIIKLMAYYISVAGRLHAHFLTLTIVLLPYWIYYLKRFDKSLYRPMIFLCLAWCIIRLHVYFSGYLSVDGIMPYRFIWD